MKPQIKRVIDIQCPEDGFTEEEELIAKLVYENTVETIYAKLPTSRMKAIVAMHFELGYTQEMLAHVFGISQPRINEEIGNIRRILEGKPFRIRKEKVRVETADLLKMVSLLSRP